MNLDDQYEIYKGEDGRNMRRRKNNARSCDFCQTWSAPWSCPAETFEFEFDPTAGSEGDWAACNICVEFVKNDDQPGLVSYITAGFKKKFRLPAAGQKMVTDRVDRLTKQFWAHRTGPPVPFAPAIDGDTQRSQ